MGRYRVWCPDLEQSKRDSTAVTASGPREAAEEWAEHNDRESADYNIINGRDAMVVVLDLDSGTMKHWIVSGEAVPSYRARPLPPSSSASAKPGEAG